MENLYSQLLKNSYHGPSLSYWQLEVVHINSINQKINIVNFPCWQEINNFILNFSHINLQYMQMFISMKVYEGFCAPGRNLIILAGFPATTQ